MNNGFFTFVETYSEDIKAFFAALVEFFKTVFAKLSEDSADEGAEA